MSCDPDTLLCQVERLADAATGFDLAAFLTTLLATLVGAGVAAAVSFWLANRERPAPIWRFDTLDLDDEPSEDGTGSARVVLTNVGDGTAYNVELFIEGSERWAPTAAVLAPGESLATRVHVPMTGSYEYDIPVGHPTDTRVVEWGKPIARVEWQQPPRRTHRRRFREVLRNPKP